MSHATHPPADRQEKQPRSLILQYKGLDGVGFVEIPPELVGHPALTPYVPPGQIEDIQAMIEIVDRYHGVKEST